jgi:hypothetical protein
MHSDTGSIQGILTEEEGSVQLTSLHELVKTEDISFLQNNLNEVNCSLLKLFHGQSLNIHILSL